jgi:hypothetical protein
VFPPVLLGLIVLAITGWSKVRKRVAEAASELSDRGV